MNSRTIEDISRLQRMILLSIILLAVLAAGARAGTVTLAWDKDPLATGYRVYQGVRLIKTVTGCRATVTLPDSGISAIQVAGFNAVGEGPAAEIKVMPLLIEVSNDLGIWTRRTVIYDEVGDRLFYRTPRLSISLTANNEDRNVPTP